MVQKGPSSHSTDPNRVVNPRPLHQRAQMELGKDLDLKKGGKLLTWWRGRRPWCWWRGHRRGTGVRQHSDGSRRRDAVLVAPSK